MSWVKDLFSTRKKHVRLTKAKRRELIKDLKNGIPRKELVVKYDVSRHVVARIALEQKDK